MRCAFCRTPVRNRFSTSVYLDGHDWYCTFRCRNRKLAGYEYHSWRQKMLPMIALLAIFAIFYFLINTIAGKAYGQTPKEITVSAVVCDTEKEALEILTTHRYGGFEKAKAVYLRLNKERNEQNEARCAHDTYTVTLVKEIASLEDVNFPGVGNVEGYVYEVTAPSGGTFYLLMFKPMQKV